MRTFRTGGRRAAIALGALLLLTVALPGAAARPAADGCPCTLATPIVGIAGGEAARLTALNLGTEASQVTLRILGRGGVERSRTVTLEPGATAQLDLGVSRGAPSLDRRGRLELRGELVVPTAGALLSGGLQVYDRATGQTSIDLVAGLPGPLPRPFLATPAVGLQAGQAARLTIVNLGARTTVHVVIRSRAGVERERDLVLAAGAWAVIDIDTAALGIGLDRTSRAEVWATVEASSRMASMLASLEALVLHTARTSADAPGITPIQLPATTNPG